MSLQQIAEVAFRLHEEGHITQDALVHILEQCINGAALENGYAEEYGLPFPDPATAPKQEKRA
jgi:hypothetical protein